MSTENDYTNEQIRKALHNAADEHGTVRAEQMRATSRAVYQWLVKNNVDWRELAIEEGLYVVSQVPRGHWSDPANHVEALRALAMVLGHSPTREEYAAAHASANQRVDSLFGGFAGLLQAAGPISQRSCRLNATSR
ncbi:hypothetical protein [Alkalilimnicola ehrlichii]|uniref:hypothetical protein n=1 Tax=Alkalilimnicola ehrlichii TaxID=351052 RepID=UPI003BA1FD04